jgi:large conductance mechanosensitive channel
MSIINCEAPAVIQDFKAFLLRGNVVDLAVAVVIGAAFGAVVTSLVKDIITPLVAAIGGNPDFSNLSVTIHNSKITYGSFLNALIAFVILAAVIFFFVVKPLNVLMARFASGKEKVPAAKDPALEVLEDIRDLLSKRKG